MWHQRVGAGNLLAGASVHPQTLLPQGGAQHLPGAGGFLEAQPDPVHLFLPLGQPASTQPARTGSLRWSPQLGSPTSARRSKPSPSSPATTRSLCSSCCRKCASSPSTSPQILSSVKNTSAQWTRGSS
ncbi:lysosomal-associated membrane protein family, member 5 [Columba livia]|uniref:Lysosomal-associated membrane protein family, member 5 n=1 Tax=Columba livia TaxID=8932 RepID=A0A2I0M9F1_COLLI|nr:lysosomal-associated membrane protein family, member 5 [Columba livia]